MYVFGFNHECLSEKGKDRNYLYKNAERKKISNSKIIMVIGCGL